MKKNMLQIFTFCLSIFLIIGCNENTGNKKTLNNSDTATNAQLKSKNGAGDVDFKIIVEQPENDEFVELYEWVKNETILQDFINTINNRIEFPGEVTIKITECGENNAFYNAEDSTISICYELIENAMSIQEENISKKEKFLNATAFIFLHEMGHAMVDRLNLPITGKEENAVDELAMIILMSDTSNITYLAAIEGAMQFYKDALDEDIKDFPFYDTHAPNIERYNDMLAIIVGAEPESSKYLVGNGMAQLHPDRAETAEVDYIKKLDSWKKILGKAWKE